jgi:hypothetical protein
MTTHANARKACTYAKNALGNVLDAIKMAEQGDPNPERDFAYYMAKAREYLDDIEQAVATVAEAPDAVEEIQKAAALRDRRALR